MSIRTYDYILVGQGIAGTALAWHLIEAGKRILVVNDSTRPSASLVAAGIYNPLTGRKLVKTWMADTIFPYAVDFYTRLETALQTRFVYPLSIYRPYRSLEEQKNYSAYASEPEIAEYVFNELESQPDRKGLNFPFGGLLVKGGGWIDLAAVIHKSREYFIEKKQYAECDFFSKNLIVNHDGVKWGYIDACKVIFCQGVEFIIRLAPVQSGERTNSGRDF